MLFLPLLIDMLMAASDWEARMQWTRGSARLQILLRLCCLQDWLFHGNLAYQVIFGLCPALLKYFASIPIRTAGTSWSPKAIAAGHYANVLWEDSTFHRVPRVSSSEQDLDACGNFIIGEPASVWGDCDKGPFQNSC